MKTIGIIAEYNPFHNGHAYQIKKIREITGADFVVVAMSGDFVQRGEPAIIDKYARTKMALYSGADFVVELPVLWATASAENFAMAGITLFEKMGCIDGICFGAETDNLPLLTALADILVEEPESYKIALSSYLKKGMNFPTARTKALCDTFWSYSLAESSHTHNSPLSKPVTSELLTEILSSPNNILALEYLKALKRSNSSIKPFLLKREGAGYHDTQIYSHSDNHALFPVGEDTKSYLFSLPETPTASATAIRNILLSKSAASYTEKSVSAADIPAKPLDAGQQKKLEASMPPSAFDILMEYLNCHHALCADDFSSLLGYQLLCHANDGFFNVGDITPDIANRLCSNRYQYHSFSQFCELNKSRNVTYTRLSRILLHLILDITTDIYALGQALDYIPYLRILGFQKNSSMLFSVLKKTADLPIISKLADAPSILSNNAMKLLERDIFAADLYEQTKAIKKRTTSHSEYTREIVRI